jgi:hypothetical protein
VRYQGEAVRYGDCRDQHIVGADRRARLFQLGADLTVCVRAGIIEGQ